ncbi:MAG TPA: TetR/AcrR family transcriptional regulator [Jatrophihabitantaceae bacterium]|jgi:AcrR family transcriptional regulator
MGSDPLFDTLFRPTTQPAQAASAAPVRATGTRSRAGNAMNRTRAALLDGARQAVEKSGTKITMAQVASAGGVAKATLYNHFRTRDAVLSALLAAEVTRLVDAAAGRPLTEALASTATSLSGHPLLRALARLEPATLTALGRVNPAADGWREARDAVRIAVADAGRGGADLVLRWIASHVVTPSDPEAIAADVEVLIAGLPAAPAARSGQQAESA